MSQRLFSTLVAFAIIILVGLLAATQHVLPPLADLENNFFTMVTPLIGTLFVLKTYLDVIDSRVADGSIKAGDIPAIVSSADFYTAMVTIGVGAAQTFGLKVLDQNAQVLLVNALLALSSILLRSFTDRTPVATQTVKAIAAQNVKPEPTPPAPPA